MDYHNKCPLEYILSVNFPIIYIIIFVSFNQYIITFFPTHTIILYQIQIMISKERKRAKKNSRKRKKQINKEKRKRKRMMTRMTIMVQK